MATIDDVIEDVFGRRRWDDHHERAPRSPKPASRSRVTDSVLDKQKRARPFSFSFETLWGKPSFKPQQPLVTSKLSLVVPASLCQAAEVAAIDCNAATTSAYMGWPVATWVTATCVRLATLQQAESSSIIPEELSRRSPRALPAPACAAIRSWKRNHSCRQCIAIRWQAAFAPQGCCPCQQVSSSRRSTGANSGSPGINFTLIESAVGAVIGV